jgi:hypothetical protein
MSSQSQFNLAQHLSTFSPNVPSLCIPRVFKNITEQRVYENLDFLGLGNINQIEMIPRVSKTGEEYKQVIIHLNWNLSDVACQARHTVLSGSDFKVIYDKAWFWKVSMFKDKSQFVKIQKTPVQRVVAIAPVIDFTPSKPREQIQRPREQIQRPREHIPRNHHTDEFGRSRQHQPREPASSNRNTDNFGREHRDETSRHNSRSYDPRSTQDHRLPEPIQEQESEQESEQEQEQEQESGQESEHDSSYSSEYNTGKGFDPDEPVIERAEKLEYIGTPIIVKKRILIKNKKPKVAVSNSI